jgi:hypothetical protein
MVCEIFFVFQWWCQKESLGTTNPSEVSRAWRGYEGFGKILYIKKGALKFVSLII